MEEIEHTHTDEITCPYCGYEDIDSWEAGDGETIGEMDCGNCHKTFYAQRIIMISYSTSKLDKY